jgi:hypothetical protein
MRAAAALRPRVATEAAAVTRACVRRARFSSRPDVYGRLIDGETTPGISAREYAARRQALADAMPAGSAMVVAANAEPLYQHDVSHVYRQSGALRAVLRGASVGGWDGARCVVVL